MKDVVKQSLRIISYTLHIQAKSHKYHLRDCNETAFSNQPSINFV